MKAFSSAARQDIGEFPPTALADLQREAAGVRTSLDVVTHQCSVLSGAATNQAREIERLEKALEEELDMLGFIEKAVVRLASSQVRQFAASLIARTEDLLQRGEAGNVRFFLWNAVRRVSSVSDEAQLAMKMLRNAGAGVGVASSKSPLAWQIEFAEQSLRESTAIVDRADEQLQMVKSILSDAEVFLERARMSRRAILDLLADGALPPSASPAAEPFH